MRGDKTDVRADEGTVRTESISLRSGILIDDISCSIPDLPRYAALQVESKHRRVHV